MFCGCCEMTSRALKQNDLSSMLMSTAPPYFSVTHLIFERPIPCLKWRLPLKLFSISISKKSSCLLLDMRIYFFSSIPSFSQAWIALSNPFDRIMQKSISPTEQGNGTFKVLLTVIPLLAAKAALFLYRKDRLRRSLELKRARTEAGTTSRRMLV